VDILATLRMQVPLIVLAASSALFAQALGSSPPTPQNDTIKLDARHIAELSVEATERNWDARNRYSYIERDEDRRLDSRGQMKSDETQVTKTTLVNGARFEQIMEHNGHPPSVEDQKKTAEDLDKLNHESSQERTIRLQKDDEDRSFLREVLDAFDFHLDGEETIDDRAAYVLQATPHPGYRADGKYGKIFSKVEGKLWVDEQNFGWIKVEGEVTQSFSMGLFVARVQRGTHVTLDEMCVGDDVWVPQRIEVRASARILFLKSLEIDRILTYSDYSQDGPYTVGR
jgi:hypothetical protein